MQALTTSGTQCWAKITLTTNIRTTHPHHGGEGKGWDSVGDLEDVFEGDRVHVACAPGGVTR